MSLLLLQIHKALPLSLSRPLFTSPHTYKLVCRYCSSGGPNPKGDKFNNKQKKEDTSRKNNNVGLWGVALVLTALAGSYAAVPLYRLFCKVWLLP